MLVRLPCKTCFGLLCIGMALDAQCLCDCQDLEEIRELVRVLKTGELAV